MEEGDQAQEKGGPSTAPKKAARRKKQPGDELVKFQVFISKREKSQLEKIRERHEFSTWRDLLTYFIDSEELHGPSTEYRASTPEPTTSARSAAQLQFSPPQSPIHIHDPLPKRARPLYAEAEASTRTTGGGQNDQHLAQIGGDAYEYVETGSEEEEEGEDEPDLAPHLSYLEISRNITDHQHGLLASTPSEKDKQAQEAWKKKVQKAQENEPLEYDYSNSTRLLPNDYFTEWSKDSHVREFIPLKEDTDNYGNVKRKLTRAQRKRAEKLLPAMTVANDGRWIAEVHSLLKWISPKCYWKDCNGENDIDNIVLERDGAVLLVTVQCKDNEKHKKKLATSRRLQHSLQPKAIFYSMNVLLPAAVVISGNQWSKLDHFMKVLNVRITSEEQFLRMQRYIVSPVVESCWKKSQATIVESMKANSCTAVVAGDGMYDSPGHAATYMTYTQMVVGLKREVEDAREPAETGEESTAPPPTKEYENTAYAVSVNVIEKRHTGLNSPAMELAGYLRSLLELSTLNVPVSEVVTDAHIGIKAIMKLAKEKPNEFIQLARHSLEKFDDMKDAFYDFLLEMCQTAEHQLDVWHRTKNDGKALMKVKLGRGGGKANYLKWIRSIKNHFFYCSQNCGGDVVKMKDMWTGMLHHIQGRHEWATGRCGHEIPLPPDPEQQRPTPLDVDSAAYTAIERQVTNKKLMQDMHYYTKFRHTGVLENYHAMSLSYASKLTYYSYPTMILRKLLAAIDQNDAVHRPVVRDAMTGQAVVRIKWSKRAGDWIPVQAKEPKSYAYIPHMLCAVLNERRITPFRFGSHSIDITLRPDVDPSKIQPNTAKFQKTVEEVLAHRQSRFAPNFYAPARDNGVEQDGEFACELGDEEDGEELDSESEGEFEF